MNAQDRSELVEFLKVHLKMADGFEVLEYPPDPNKFVVIKKVRQQPVDMVVSEWVPVYYYQVEMLRYGKGTNKIEAGYSVEANTLVIREINREII